MVAILNGFYTNAFSGLLTFNGLDFGAKLTVFLLSVLVALIITLVYRFMVDQSETKRIRVGLKELKGKMNDAKKKNNTKDMAKYMNQSLKLNNKMMKMSLKPMVVSLLIAVLLLPWLQSTYDKTIDLNSEFSYMNISTNVTVQGNMTYFGGQAIKSGEVVSLGQTRWQVKSIDLQNKKVRLSMIFMNLPFSIPIVGKYLEWLGFYILWSIPFTILFRKLLGVH